MPGPDAGLTDDDGELFTPAQVRWAARRAFARGKRLGALEAVQLLTRVRSIPTDDVVSDDELDFDAR
jgi:hypothetical protein